jgi:hypothetical protein
MVGLFIGPETGSKHMFTDICDVHLRHITKMDQKESVCQTLNKLRQLILGYICR